MDTRARSIVISAPPWQAVSQGGNTISNTRGIKISDSITNKTLSFSSTAGACNSEAEKQTSCIMASNSSSGNSSKNAVIKISDQDDNSNNKNNTRVVFSTSPHTSRHGGKQEAVSSKSKAATPVKTSRNRQPEGVVTSKHSDHNRSGASGSKDPNRPLADGFITASGKHRSEYNECKRRYTRAKFVIQKAEESIQKGEVQSEENQARVAWAKQQISYFESLKKQREEFLLKKNL